MLIGYVSDERYVAISGVAVEFERDGESVAVIQSSPRGAIYADIEPGQYRATLAKDGFGSKSVAITVDPANSYQFRLLTDGLLGYMWPKWVRSGERSEFRVHSVEAFQLTLWRYGLEREFIRMLGWFDEHGPRAVMQITPDGDYTQTGVQWNKQGYGNPHHTQIVAGPERSGLYYLHAKTESGAFFSFPWIVAPAEAKREDRRRRCRPILGTRTTTSAAAAITSTRPVCRQRRSSTRGSNLTATRPRFVSGMDVSGR